MLLIHRFYLELRADLLLLHHLLNLQFNFSLVNKHVRILHIVEIKPETPATLLLVVVSSAETFALQFRKTIYFTQIFWRNCRWIRASNRFCRYRSSIGLNYYNLYLILLNEPCLSANNNVPYPLCLYELPLLLMRINNHLDFMRAPNPKIFSPILTLYMVTNSALWGIKTLSWSFNSFSCRNCRWFSANVLSEYWAITTIIHASLLSLSFGNCLRKIPLSNLPYCIFTNFSTMSLFLLRQGSSRRIISSFCLRFFSRLCISINCTFYLQICSAKHVIAAYCSFSK